MFPNILFEGELYLTDYLITIDTDQIRCRIDFYNDEGETTFDGEPIGVVSKEGA